MRLDELLRGESETIEYKVTEPDNREKYLKTVVAFANGRGGRIVFGVADGTREVAGIPQDEVFGTMDAITNTIQDSCEPKIIPRNSMTTIDGKTLIVVEILPGMQPPYYIKRQGPSRGVYIRVGGTTRPAESYQIQEMNSDNKTIQKTDPKTIQKNDQKPIQKTIQNEETGQKTDQKSETGPKTIQKTDQKPIQNGETGQKTGQKTGNTIAPISNEQGTPVSEKEAMLLRLLREKPTITQRDCMRLLGLSLGGTKYYFDILQEKGILRRVGTNRSGYWEILSKEDEADA